MKTVSFSTIGPREFALIKWYVWERNGISECKHKWTHFFSSSGHTTIFSGLLSLHVSHVGVYGLHRSSNIWAVRLWQQVLWEQCEREGEDWLTLCTCHTSCQEHLANEQKMVVNYQSDTNFKMKDWCADVHKLATIAVHSFWMAASANEHLLDGGLISAGGVCVRCEIRQVIVQVFYCSVTDMPQL